LDDIQINLKRRKKQAQKAEKEEYGIILRRKKKYRHRIFPQKGKKPKETEDYKIV
jgi:hypothetical protein